MCICLKYWKEDNVPWRKRVPSVPLIFLWGKIHIFKMSNKIILLIHIVFSGFFVALLPTRPICSWTSFGGKIFSFFLYFTNSILFCYRDIWQKIWPITWQVENQEMGLWFTRPLKFGIFFFKGGGSLLLEQNTFITH